MGGAGALLCGRRSSLPASQLAGRPRGRAYVRTRVQPSQPAHVPKDVEAYDAIARAELSKVWPVGNKQMDRIATSLIPPRVGVKRAMSGIWQKIGSARPGGRVVLCNRGNCPRD